MRKGGTKYTVSFKKFQSIDLRMELKIRTIVTKKQEKLTKDRVLEILYNKGCEVMVEDPIIRVRGDLDDAKAIYDIRDPENLDLYIAEIGDELLSTHNVGAISDIEKMVTQWKMHKIRRQIDVSCDPTYVQFAQKGYVIQVGTYFGNLEPKADKNHCQRFSTNNLIFE